MTEDPACSCESVSDDCDVEVSDFDRDHRHRVHDDIAPPATSAGCTLEHW